MSGRDTVVVTARGSSVVTLEQTGKNRGYRDKDVRGHCPVSHCCVDEAPEELCSVIDMRAVSKQLKEEAGMDVVYSRDAGRYLCDFAYYCSLYHGQGRAALIHIPTSGGLASADRLVPLLQTLIRTMLPADRPVGDMKSRSSSTVQQLQSQLPPGAIHAKDKYDV
ncbi:hypothetical protein F2P81_007047 [Scophthalmus maximus]|uniref:Pyroglutamyl-peptidase 1-like protein n=1 Tax=Scophthalmus maximus TaxID=52904 RepID=A0A6A4T8G4_SCOMX|nr:hypothetical protein F2P81_007047 [Scophthalmus maximus]